MAEEHELFRGTEDADGNPIRMSYPKIHEMLRGAIQDRLVADTFFRVYRHSGLVFRDSKDGISVPDYDYQTGKIIGYKKCRIIPRRLWFHGGYTALIDQEILARGLPLDIIDERNGKRFVPKDKLGEYEKAWAGESFVHHPSTMVPMWGQFPSFDLSKKLEGMIGWNLVMTMWDHALRYGMGNHLHELVEDARRRSGIETREERLKRRATEYRIRAGERGDIHGKPRRPRFVSFDEMLGCRKVGRGFEG